jgi:hypothetical protein
MVLVPRQLLRSGMTGNVPYYGGRFTPAQAYAASHPSARPPARPPIQPPTGRVAPVPLPTRTPDTEAALRHLLDSGVLTAAEYDELLTRITR